MKRVVSAISLYQYHPVVFMLAISLITLMVAVKIFMSFGNYFMVEELMTLWLIVWMSLAFQIGIIVKRQVTTPWAHLLPGYRWSHASVVCCIFVVITALTLPWLTSLFGFISPLVAKIALTKLCIGTFLVTMVVAYISIRIMVLVSYALLLMAASHVMDILDIFLRVPFLSTVVTIGIGVLMIIFLWRILNLKEEDFEYSFLLSWPVYKSSEGVAASHKSVPYQKSKISAFYKMGNSFQKAMHWVRLESEDIGNLGAVLLVAVAIFEFYIVKFAPVGGFYTRPYANFFLFVMLPVFISLCFNYRMFSFKDWAVMLPIVRLQLAKQWGILMAVSFLSSWILVCVLFAIAPDLILNLGILKSFKIWEYLVFTGVFGLMTLGVLAYVAQLENSRKVIVYIFLYGVYVSAEYMLVAWYDERTILAHMLLASAIGVWFCKKAYDQWR
ncbi:MAG: hypothetical protein WCH62_07920 [Candidatus Omnitrophota bacterium]